MTPPARSRLADDVRPCFDDAMTTPITPPPRPVLPVTLALEDPGTAEVRALLAAAAAFSASLYPAESNHHLELASLRARNLRFFVARDAGGRAIGTGAVKLEDGWAEIKAMWLAETARGHGLSRMILDRLIATAGAAGIGVVRLETGIANHAAYALYRAAGFVERGPFADYRPDPLSVFMERDAAVVAPPQG